MRNGTDRDEGTHRFSLPEDEDALRSGQSGYFANARNFTVSGLAFYDIKAQVEPTTNETLKWLAGGVIPGAEFDSSERVLPPQCHPLTRVALRTRILDWSRHKKPGKKLLWLHGPAGVGKSAVMQTLAESENESDLLGATLFFSRPNHRNDPNRVIITLAYQLATRIPSYQEYAKEQMNADPRLLEKGMKEQFKKFIIDPFALRDICKGELDRLIVLDGLDECEGEDAQCQIIELVSTFVLTFPEAPLAWIIASRPEPHLNIAFMSATINKSYEEEEIPVDSPDACQDVERYLRAELSKIGQRYPYSVPQGSQWPTESELLTVASVASGLFAFASTAVRFIDDRNLGDPVSQLEYFLSFVKETKLSAGDRNPLAMLDLLYSRILSSVPARSLDTMKLLVGYYVIEDKFRDSRLDLSLLETCNLLAIKQNIAYGALQKLHSVLYIPPPDRAHFTGLSFYHASFSDFLQDPHRSQEFSLDRLKIMTDVWWCYFRVLQQAYDMDDSTKTPQLANVTQSWPFPRHYGPRRLLELCGSIWADQLVPGEIYHKSPEASPISLTLEQRCEALGQINFAKFYGGYMYSGNDTVRTYNYLRLVPWLTSKDVELQLQQRGVVSRICLSDVDIDRIAAHKITYPFHFFYRVCSFRWELSSTYHLDYHRDLLRHFRSLKDQYPSFAALLFGATPSKRCLIFRSENTYRKDHKFTDEIFVLPYH